MLKKTMKYIDFDGNERVEDFWFHLTEAELAEKDMTNNGNMTRIIEKIINERDGAKITELFKEIIQKSYGVKSVDGRSFVKTPEALQEFMSTQAYSDLFMELATKAESANAFIEGIMPENLKKNMPSDPHSMLDENGRIDMDKVKGLQSQNSK